ncbi:hypothetical protein [Clostridium thermopalmarium]|uniref:Uncharacterized protein n=1 Tax=Clostridium thermopalmarium DSM 5974 TaxID=1121340 RepID=A0A2T0APD5_9CLOT|nr:hypothetical protein [Clostridium thermopalmarium]PRR70884.1 hypothetical protein CPAL_19740 [Clostridium thermopalmarium DSM 5974]PVZ28808.1 hypothetical protein LX19_00112 [Clostridium thermopalmarium DSM 5974]
MKAAITGYITAVINNYTRIIENLEERRVDKPCIRKYEAIREEFYDLLEFVEDLPEETKRPITVIFNSSKEETYD